MTGQETNDRNPGNSCRIREQQGTGIVIGTTLGSKVRVTMGTEEGSKPCKWGDAA